jgi:drug/metabolite transporter (DMT)-like permease
MSRNTLLILLFLNAVWAGSYSATKALMEHAPFYLITSCRYFIAAPPLLVLAWTRGGLSMGALDLLKCVLMGIAVFSVGPALMYAGVDLSRAADAAIITSAEPLLVGLGAFLFLREKIGGRTWGALAIASVGALVLSEVWRESGAVNPVGTLLIAAAVFFEATYSVIGKGLLARHSPLKIASVSLGAACVVNASALTALDMWGYASGLTGSDWALMGGYLAFLCTIIGYTFWYVALKQDATANVAITIFLQPVLGILIAWLWVAETPTAVQISGTGIILAGVALAVFGPKNLAPRRAVEPVPPPIRKQTEGL